MIMLHQVFTSRRSLPGRAVAGAALAVSLACACILCASGVRANTYFISPRGDDSRSGLSVNEAWKTLDRLNRAVFQPGDRILFESGGVWNGQLKPQGSGEAGKPIIMSSYGGEARPVINLGKAEGAAIRLTNQAWWEISNLEITSAAAPEMGIGRQGIVAKVQGADQHIRHIVVRNCFIHDIWGQLGGRTQYVGRNSCAILVTAPRSGSSTLDDVLVENNRIERFDKVGIAVDGGQSGVIVRRNVMDNLGGDGIICSGGTGAVIEYNVVKRSCLRSGSPDLPVDQPGQKSWWPHTAAIWIHHTAETVMQFNEVYDTGRQPRNGDGEAYDFDFGCRRCLCQYNYSKHNHGLLLIMYDATDNVTRYNISENDQTHLIQLQCAISEKNLIYNNVFYVDYGTADFDFFCGDDGAKDKSKLGAYLFNNILYAAGPGRFRTVYTSGYAWERKFDETVKLPKAPGTLFHHNLYFGPWKNGLPDDAEKLVADPLLVAPGTGGEGLTSLTGYKLKPGSPCIGAGMPVAQNGGRDFYGTPVNGQPIDIGAYQHSKAGAAAGEAELIPASGTRARNFDGVANRALAAMKARAEELKIHGVAVVACFDAERGGSWSSQMVVVGTLKNAPTQKDPGSNLLAIAYSKAAEMADTLKASGSGIRKPLKGEFGWQGGLIRKGAAGYLIAAFSGGKSEDDLKVSQAGLDVLAKDL
jgi:hypothetical protein